MLEGSLDCGDGLAACNGSINGNNGLQYNDLSNCINSLTGAGLASFNNPLTCLTGGVA